jgi:hypothetical protein
MPVAFWDTILGRTKQVRPDLDRLFGLPSAAVTLEAVAGFAPTGDAAVCFTSLEGEAFRAVVDDVRRLLDARLPDRPGALDALDRLEGLDGPDVPDALDTSGPPGASGRSGAESSAAEEASDRPPVEMRRDAYGYTWLVLHRPADDVADLVTDVHAVNAGLEEAGFGPQLLCSLIAFREVGGNRPLALVYLYKRGTFYPFAPLPGDKRDNALELQVRAALADDLRIEGDLTRWFPVWRAPGM